jgi:hypothetical protein
VTRRSVRLWASTACPERAICARMTESFESLPLPGHPLLAAWALALNDAGYWANLMDAKWRWVFSTDEMLLSYRDMEAPTTPPIGSHFFSAEARQFIAMVGGPWATPEVGRAWFLDAGRYMLAGTPGGCEELRRVVDPALADLVDQLQHQDLPPYG